ncbi:unnamed protein product [Candidula unifasciata]|uniref:Uncharacterized protein n=1 Tax=Candidula unifasciata TaxID=100452 RepID=A0A8S3YP30_9EUPU|nr:unnamed protein product [Candidula unifasciata]
MSAEVRRDTVTFFIKLISISIVLGTSFAAEFIDSLAVSETKSVPSDISTSSRHKRAPGWGKRAPGWGKRAPGWGKRSDVSKDLFDPQEAVLDNLRISALKSNSYLPEEISSSEQKKRDPGWGKISCQNDAYAYPWLRDRSNALPYWRKRRIGAEQDNGIIDIERRAPGWGKRAPGLGKRNYEEDLSSNNADMDSGYDSWDSNSNVDEQLFENSEISQEPMISYTVLPGRTLLSQDVFSVESGATGLAGKRAPGWGKRDYHSEMADEAVSQQKRAPGWGKRSYHSDAVDEDAQTEKRAPGWGKRAPGWGKRAPGWGKRAPGWGKRSQGWEGKRAPGWGKRSYQTEVIDEDATTDKRAPGWGKRAPGWGKRTYETELEDEVSDKRAPGWGKRAATRVKRSQNSINKSTKDNCNKLQFLESAYIAKIQELAGRRSTECGNTNDANKILGSRDN